MSANPTDDGLRSRASSIVVEAFDRELGQEDDAIDAMNALCTRLGGHLARWIGADGWQALLVRALASASPTQATGALVLEPDATLGWNGERNLAQARDACVEVLETVAHTLGRFIGAELALRLVEEGLAARDDQASGGADHG